MVLLKEIYREEYEGYVQEFNEKGLLIFTETSSQAYGTSKRIFYNEDNQIIRVLETQRGNDNNLLEERFVSNYEYNGESYRIITYKTEKRDGNEINTYENLVLGKEKWNAVDEVFSIHEFKVKDGQIISERYNNLHDGTHYLYSFRYKNGLKVSEIKTKSEGNISINFDYKKTVYLYEDGKLFEEQEIRKHNEVEYISTKKNYFYNSSNQVERIEHYGRYNSRLYLYMLEEKIWKGNILTKKTAQISYHEMFMGYFDLAELHAALKVGYDYDDEFISSYNEKYLDKSEFDYESYNIEEFDSHKNVIESKDINPNDIGEIYERRIYHHEYNDETLLEFTVCFAIDSKGEIQKRHTRKYYYHK